MIEQSNDKIMQIEHNKNNCKLVGFVNKKAREMAFCQGRRKTGH